MHPHIHDCLTCVASTPRRSTVPSGPCATLEGNTWTCGRTGPPCVGSIHESTPNAKEQGAYANHAVPTTRTNATAAWRTRETTSTRREDERTRLARGKHTRSVRSCGCGGCNPPHGPQKRINCSHCNAPDVTPGEETSSKPTKRCNSETWKSTAWIPSNNCTISSTRVQAGCPDTAKDAKESYNAPLGNDSPTKRSKTWPNTCSNAPKKVGNERCIAHATRVTWDRPTIPARWDQAR